MKTVPEESCVMCRLNIPKEIKRYIVSEDRKTITIISEK